MNGFDDLDLLLLQRSVQLVHQHLGYAENGSERCAQFMAHGGQKLIFGARGAGQLQVDLMQLAGALLDTLSQSGTLLRQIRVCPVQRLLTLAPLGDVRESDYRADQLAVVEDWMRPVFDRKTAAVCAPEQFVLHVRSLAGAIGGERTALLFRHWRAVCFGVVNQAVNAFSDEV